MTDAEIRTRLQDRLQAVEERILATCKRSGRARAEVTLIAVTKSVGVRVARLLPELGVVDLGESRPQELARKAKEILSLEPDAQARDIHWHMIGHLQRNKIEPTIEYARLIHSVDSSRLLEALNRQSEGKQMPILLEVNASREPNKHGFAPEEIEGVVASQSTYPNVRIDGLMTMAAFADDPELARPTFAEVRRLRNAAGLTHLSMGMSNDFEVAIEEGATLIRLGSVLFEGMPSG